MKSTIYYISAAILSISMLFTSCKKEEAEPEAETTSTNAPAITKAYYIQSKQDGAWNTNQTDSQINLQTTEGFGWENYINLFNDDWVNFTFEMPGTGDHYGSAILALQGQTLSFTSSTTLPYAYYQWMDYSSVHASAQSGSSCHITSVVPDGCDDGVHDSFKVTGTFTCNVATSGGTDKAVSSGKFKIRVTENF